MKKFNSITRNQDFKRIYVKGRYLSSRLLVTYVMNSRLNTVRLGITTSKKIGNAVQRNRSRRIIRAAYASIREKLANRHDIIFVARKDTPFAKSHEILKEMSYQLKRLGVFR